MTDQAAIRARGLVKSYGGHRVLDGLDLTVPAGSVYALLGGNGAGKTTTVRILSTLTRPDGGQAAVAGFDVTAQRAKVRPAISLTGQYAALDEVQTGAENLRMMGRLSGLGADQARTRAAELLRQFDLAEAGKRQVGTYSGGMRRRLDLAASLVARPKVIFLDEPTTGLDLPSRQALWATIAGLAAGGTTIFLTTQYLEEADRLADRIAVLAGGRLTAEAPPPSSSSGWPASGWTCTRPVPPPAPSSLAALAVTGRLTRPRSPWPCPPTAARPTSAPCWTALTRPVTWSATSPCTAPPSTTCSSPSPATPHPRQQALQHQPLSL